VAACGYLWHLKSAYGWGTFTPMAFHTAVGIVVLGVGLMALAWRQSRQAASTATTWLLPGLVSMGLGMMTLFLWQALATQPEQHQTPIAIETILLVCGMGAAALVGWVMALAHLARTRLRVMVDMNRNLKQEIDERVRVEQSLCARADELDRTNSSLQEALHKQQEAEQALQRAHAELQAKLEEMKRLNESMLGREDRVLELKEEIKALQAQLAALRMVPR
jgi:C4-dicarboxylate-specific signal transduction histidine kinase